MPAWPWLQSGWVGLASDGCVCVGHESRHRTELQCPAAGCALCAIRLFVRDRVCMCVCVCFAHRWLHCGFTTSLLLIIRRVGSLLRQSVSHRILDEKAHTPPFRCSMAHSCGSCQKGERVNSKIWHCGNHKLNWAYGNGPTLSQLISHSGVQIMDWVWPLIFIFADGVNKRGRPIETIIIFSLNLFRQRWMKSNIINVCRSATVLIKTCYNVCSYFLISLVYYLKKIFFLAIHSVTGKAYVKHGA